MIFKNQNSTPLVYTSGGVEIRSLPWATLPPRGTVKLFHKHNYCAPDHRLYIGNGVVTNDHRARKLIPELARMWHNRERGFSGMVSLEFMFRPKWMYELIVDPEMERLKANYIAFQANSQRSGKTSLHILEKLYQAYTRCPEYFDPRNSLEDTLIFRDLIIEFDPQTDNKAEAEVVACLKQLSDPSSLLPVQEQPGVMEKVQASYDAWWQKNKDTFARWWKMKHPNTPIPAKNQHKQIFPFFMKQRHKPLLTRAHFLMLETRYVRHNDTIVKCWKALFVRLRTKYASNALNMFVDPQDATRAELGSFYDQVMTTDFDNGYEPIDPLRLRIGNYLRTFWGVEWKVASMYVIFFQSTPWHTHSEFWERFKRIPFVPVDLHHLRMIPGMGIIYEYVDDRRDQTSPVLSHYLAELCYELKVDHDAVSQTIFNSGQIFHAKWNQLKGDRHAQMAICQNLCPIVRFCQFVVPVAAATNTRKKALRSIRAETRKTHDDQKALFPELRTDLTEEDVNLIYTQHNRGGMNWENAYERPALLYINSFVDENETLPIDS